MAGDEDVQGRLSVDAPRQDRVDVDELCGLEEARGRHRAAGGSTKSSRLTSRQSPQSAEMARNSDSIQSAAALMPWPGGRSVSMLERVLRLLKETILAMLARM